MRRGAGGRRGGEEGRRGGGSRGEEGRRGEGEEEEEEGRRGGEEEGRRERKEREGGVQVCHSTGQISLTLGLGILSSSARLWQRAMCLERSAEKSRTVVSLIRLRVTNSVSSSLAHTAENSETTTV